MRRVEQSACLVDLAVGEGTHEGIDTGDFGDDVAHALLHRVVFQLVERFLECLERIVGLGDAVGDHTQVGHAEDFGGLLASGATLGILAVVELVRSLSVKHQQFQTVLVEIEFLLGDVLQRAQLWTAVKTQRMAESATHGCVLIKTTGGRTRHVVFRLDGGVDQRHTTGIGCAITQTVHIIQRQGGGAGHGCGGAQTGTERHAGGECRVEALHRIEAGFTQCPGNAYRVGGPAFHTTGLQTIEVGFGNVSGINVGNHAHLGVFTRLERDERAVRQCDRQAQARVVVGVFADQVHTARCGPYASRFLTVGGSEQVGRVLHTLVVRERLNEFNSSHWCFVLWVLLAFSLRYRLVRARGSAWR